MMVKKKETKSKSFWSNLFVRNIILALSGLLVLGVLTSVVTNVLTRHNRYIQVPDFTGMDISQARQASKKASLKLEVNDSLYVTAYPGGMVLEQTPAAGTQVKSGRRIFVTLNSFRQKIVDIPYVTGYSLRQAKNNLEMAGFEIDKIVYENDMATNNVIEQRYKGQVITSGRSVPAERGSGITLVVGWSSESRNPAIPKVVGFPLKEAKSRLWEAGFNIADVVYDKDITMLDQKSARVYVQSPVQGLRASPGSTVSLKLTLDAQMVEKGSKDSDNASKRVVREQVEQEQQEQQEANEAQEEI